MKWTFEWVKAPDCCLYKDHPYIFLLSIVEASEFGLNWIPIQVDAMLVLHRIEICSKTIAWLVWWVCNCLLTFPSSDESECIVVETICTGERDRMSLFFWRVNGVSIRLYGSRPLFCSWCSVCRYVYVLYLLLLTYTWLTVLDVVVIK